MSCKITSAWLEPPDAREVTRYHCSVMVAPLYVVETLPPAVISATITEQWYRVTSRASGGSNQADVILQLMFRTP